LKCYGAEVFSFTLSRCSGLFLESTREQNVFLINGRILLRSMQPSKNETTDEGRDHLSAAPIVWLRLRDVLPSARPHSHPFSPSDKSPHILWHRCCAFRQSMFKLLPTLAAFTPTLPPLRFSMGTPVPSTDSAGACTPAATRAPSPSGPRSGHGRATLTRTSCG